MAEFPYVAVTAKLATFLEEIKSVGIPETASISWLKEIGFTSSNDQSIPRILQFIGFVDSSRQPTDKWRRFRDKTQSGTVIAAAIQEGYSKLYQVYPDAHFRSDDELVNFFRSHSEAGNQAVRRTANTFKALCSLADFDQVQERETIPEAGSATVPATVAVPQPQVANQTLTPSLKVDVQIHISANAGKSQIEEVFKSMAKYLYNRDVEEETVHEGS